MCRYAGTEIRRHQHSAPVRTVQLANAFGLEVYSSAFRGTEDISGMLRKEDGGYAIYVNKAHHRNRRRFTIAHALAHYILHKDVIGNGIVDDALYHSGLGSKMEVEANNLAADILMPWHLLAEENLRETPLQELANKYQVSIGAMAIRLQVPVVAVEYAAAEPEQEPYATAS